MMENKIISVTCPACCEAGDFRIYPKINVSENTALKELIFNRDIFRFRCPLCGEQILVSYDCTYIDEDKNFIVSLITQDESSHIEAEGYTLRIVRSINEFVEKIALMEDGIDDRIAELYKIMLEDQFEEDRPGTEVLGIYYGGQNAEDKSLTFFVITGNAENCRAILSYDIYRSIVSQFDNSPEMAKADTEINRMWAISALKNGFSDTQE